MRSVEEHRAIVLDGVEPLPAVDTPLLDALGQVLARDVVAPWPLPLFDNSSMDGYAVRADDVAGAADGSPATLTGARRRGSGIGRRSRGRAGHRDPHHDGRADAARRRRGRPGRVVGRRHDDRAR